MVNGHDVMAFGVELIFQHEVKSERDLLIWFKSMSDLVSFAQWTILANLIGLLMVIMCCLFLLYFQLETNVFREHSNSQKRYLVNFVQMTLFQITSIWPNLIEWLPLSWLCLILVPHSVHSKSSHSCCSKIYNFLCSCNS